MPHILIKLTSGRTREQKLALAERVSVAVMAALDADEGAVSVAIEDVAQGEWKERVYDPDIKGRSELMYKHPGYTLT